MFWVGIATLIMLLTGAGDDTAEFRTRLKRMEKIVQTTVPDLARQQKAQLALAMTSTAFNYHRQRLDEVSKCIAKADAAYHATRADYAKCTQNIEKVWTTAVGEFVSAERAFRSSVSPDELSAIYNQVIKK